MYKILLALLMLALAPVMPVLAEVQALQPLTTPRPAPAFEFVDIQGTTHRLQDYADRVVVVNFWATWCPPCIRELPALERLQQHLADVGGVVLTVNFGEDAEDIAVFLQRVIALELPVLLDPAMTAASPWRLRGIPTSYIINPQGQIVFTVLGDQPWDAPVMVEQIRALAEP